MVELLHILLIYFKASFSSERSQKPGRLLDRLEQHPEGVQHHQPQPPLGRLCRSGSCGPDHRLLSDGWIGAAVSGPALQKIPGHRDQHRQAHQRKRGPGHPPQGHRGNALLLGRHLDSLCTLPELQFHLLLRAHRQIQNNSHRHPRQCSRHIGYRLAERLAAQSIGELGIGEQVKSV